MNVEVLKVAIINICIITFLSNSNLKVAACGDEATENYHLDQQLPFAHEFQIIVQLIT